MHRYCFSYFYSTSEYHDWIISCLFFSRIVIATITDRPKIKARRRVCGLLQKDFKLKVWCLKQCDVCTVVASLTKANYYRMTMQKVSDNNALSTLGMFNLEWFSLFSSSSKPWWWLLLMKYFFKQNKCRVGKLGCF